MTSMCFSDVAYTQKKKTTRKARFLSFLSEMNDVLPWDCLLQPILQKDPKPGRGRRPIAAAVMLRIYFMQQGYNLSDPAMEDSLYDVESMRPWPTVCMATNRSSMATKPMPMPNASRKPKPKASSGGSIARPPAIENEPVPTARLTARATASEPGLNTSLVSSSTAGATIKCAIEA